MIAGGEYARFFLCKEGSSFVLWRVSRFKIFSMLVYPLICDSQGVRATTTCLTGIRVTAADTYT